MGTNTKRTAIWTVPNSEKIADDVERIMRDELDRVVLRMWGMELVLHPEYKYYDDDTRGVKGVGVFLNDTSGG